MFYSKKDKFLLRGLEVEVAFINHGMAWVVPLEDGVFEGNRVYIGAVVDILSPDGLDRLGYKALSVNKTECQAV